MSLREINLKQSDISEDWSIEAADLTNKLLKRKPKERLGANNGIIDIKEHSWFRNVNWVELYRKEVKASFVPKPGDNFDSNYCNKIDEKDMKTYDHYLQKVNNEKHFADFYYNFNDIGLREKDSIPFEYEGKTYRFSNIHDIKYENTNLKQDNKSTNKNSMVSTNISGFKQAESIISQTSKEIKLDITTPLSHRKMNM